ncbi:hypothetical protein D8B26_006515 [Coccidioides posadasii str. Silveira]|uniref:uncharacterized protein n=1 Tax=Coccidioides posadasii (strain RMSCC 757 / Silveira) TaxID=443226 RepID=UPI001BEDD141|nr:hypothetical protein D8B26_006515 [Coccidioides posadasii str. Silveira]
MKKVLWIILPPDYEWSRGFILGGSFNLLLRNYRVPPSSTRLSTRTAPMDLKNDIFSFIIFSLPFPLLNCIIGCHPGGMDSLLIMYACVGPATSRLPAVSFGYFRRFSLG